jgi:hypothetical protein
MDFEKMTDDELLAVDRPTLSTEERDEVIGLIKRRILWQDIVAKGDGYRMLAINICRFQDGHGLRTAMDVVDMEYYRNKKAAEGK